MTTQRHVRDIAADAVTAFGKGRTPIPYWRAVDPNAPATRHLAGGAAFVRTRRAEER